MSKGATEKYAYFICLLKLIVLYHEYSIEKYLNLKYDGFYSI
jgi:hypothetical protein